MITIDIGPESAALVLGERVYEKGIKLNFIQAGKRMENAFAKNFISKCRDECLSTKWFMISLKGSIPKGYAEITVGL